MVEIAEQQRVGDEAGLVAHDHGLLLQPLGQGLDVGEHIVSSDDGADDLDELLHGGRVEEVHSDDARGLLGRDGDLGHRQGRGVRREDSLLADYRIERSEDLLLERQLLGHRLDDELAGGQLPQVGCIADPAMQGCGVLR